MPPSRDRCRGFCAGTHNPARSRAALKDPRLVRLYWQRELMADSASPDAEKLQRHLQRLAGVKRD